MRRRRKAPRRHSPFQQRMSPPHHGDEAIAHKSLRPDFWANVAEYADVEVNTALTQGGHVLLALIGKSQRHLRRFARCDRLQRGAEDAGDIVAGPDGESANERGRDRRRPPAASPGEHLRSDYAHGRAIRGHAASAPCVGRRAPVFHRRARGGCVPAFGSWPEARDSSAGRRRARCLRRARRRAQSKD